VVKKFLRGLAGGIITSVSGGGSLHLGNIQNYEYLKQALVELSKDPNYSVYYWNFKSYNSVTEKRKLSEGQEYSPESKRKFDRGDEICFPSICVSLEHARHNKSREIYIRILNSGGYSRQYLDRMVTPEERRSVSGAEWYLSSMHSGTYLRANKRVFYLVGHSDGLSHLSLRDDVFGYYNLIREKFAIL
jgi:hypothetical protein